MNTWRGNPDWSESESDIFYDFGRKQWRFEREFNKEKWNVGLWWSRHRYGPLASMYLFIGLGPLCFRWRTWSIKDEKIKKKDDR